MEITRKITVEVPRDLLEKAQRASGSDIAQTVLIGLQLVAASQAYSTLRQFRGKVHLPRVKSGNLTGIPPLATDSSLSGPGALQAAAS
jgi:hypothetical protein